MEEEWNWKVSSMAGLRESVDDKMEEQIAMEELKNEKVRGKEEKIDWRLQGETEIERGGNCPKRDTGRCGFCIWRSSLCALMNPIKPRSISFACCKKAGLRLTPFHLLRGMRWKANIRCVSNSHKSFEAKAPLTPPWPSPPSSELHWSNFLFPLSYEGGERKENRFQISIKGLAVVLYSSDNQSWSDAYRGLSFSSLCKWIGVTSWQQGSCGPVIILV